MKDIRAKILSNEKIRAKYFKMLLESSYIAREAMPGQFVEIKCSDTLDPLLRRPLGIHRVGTKTIELLYEVVGKGTDILSKKKKGDFLDVLGPLGNGFKILSGSSILIAGGIGVAPMVFLAEALPDKKIKPTILIGAKTKKEILCDKNFGKISPDVYIATDDGSRGKRGLVSELFEKLLENSRPNIVYACGPYAMLKTIAGICKKKKINCQVSMEEKMACGIGVCLGCGVKVKDGYKLVCKDGPIFDAREIVWI